MAFAREYVPCIGVKVLSNIAANLDPFALIFVVPYLNMKIEIFRPF